MEQSKKNFWDRPEGNTGLAIVGALGIGAVVLGLGFWTTIVAILSNIIYAGILGGIIFTTTALLMNDSIRTSLKALFYLTCKKITGVFIPIDPIGIIEYCLTVIRKRLGNIEKTLGKLMGFVRKTQAQIDEGNENIAGYKRTAKAAMKMGQEGKATLEAAKAMREQEFLDKQLKTLKNMQMAYDNIRKLKENLNLLCEDKEHQVKILKMEYESVKARHYAMKEAEKILSGGSELALFEQAMEATADDMYSMLGEIDSIMEVSKDFMSTADLQKAVYNEQGLEMLAKWNSEGLLGYDKNRNQKIRVDSSQNSGNISLEEQEQYQLEQNQTNSFSKLFNK